MLYWCFYEMEFIKINKNYLLPLQSMCLQNILNKKNVNHVIIWSYLENNNDYHTLDYHTLDYHNIVYAECAIESA